MGLLNAIGVHSYGTVASGLPFDYHRNNLPVNMTEYSLYDDDNKINGVVSQPLMTAKMVNEFCKDVNDGQVASWFWWNCVGTNNLTDNTKANMGQSLIIANRVSNPKSVYVYVDQTGFPADHALIALNDNTKYPATGGPYQTPYKSEFGTDWTLTSKFYAFRRLTQSIKTGSVSLRTKTTPNYASASSQDDVYSAAFRLPSGKYCVVLSNQSAKSYTVNLKVDGLKSPATTNLTTYYTADGSNDVSRSDVLTHGTIKTTARPYSVLCFVQK